MSAAFIILMAIAGANAAMAGVNPMRLLMPLGIGFSLFLWALIALIVGSEMIEDRIKYKKWIWPWQAPWMDGK